MLMIALAFIKWLNFTSSKAFIKVCPYEIYSQKRRNLAQLQFTDIITFLPSPRKRYLFTLSIPQKKTFQ